MLLVTLFAPASKLSAAAALAALYYFVLAYQVRHGTVIASGKKTCQRKAVSVCKSVSDVGWYCNVW